MFRFASFVLRVARKVHANGLFLFHSTNSSPVVSAPTTVRSRTARMRIGPPSRSSCPTSSTTGLRGGIGEVGDSARVRFSGSRRNCRLWWRIDGIGHWSYVLEREISVLEACRFWNFRVWLKFVVLSLFQPLQVRPFRNPQPFFPLSTKLRPLPSARQIC